MKTLSRSAFASGAVDAPHAAIAPRAVRILQIGDGVFLRGFFDWMVDIANEKGVYDGGVAIALARPRSEPPALPSQDNLFTVLLRGRMTGGDIEDRHVVGAVQTTLDPHRQWRETRAIAEAPELRFVVSNTTEAGIEDVAEPYHLAACPRSFPAKAAALLKARFDALGGADAPGLVFLPCELIEANGATLRRCVLAHALRWGCEPEFAAWIESRNLFLDTLVDRSVPGFPAAEAEALFARWGYRDPLAVMAEPFHLWVIQGPADIARELPLAEAGLNVLWTRDLRPYRERKVRLLNGAHTAVALPAFLAGIDTVRETVEDPLFAHYLRTLLFDDIAPFVPLPDRERRAYAEAVIERFANPFLRHELISIALNSLSKWKARILPTVKDAAAAGLGAPPNLAFSLAALLRFYRGRTQGGAYLGARDRGDYPLRDDPAALAIFASIWAEAGSEGAADAASRLLREAELWGEDLSKIGGLESETRAAASAIERLGVGVALEERLSRAPTGQTEDRF
jgi:tagaturonate reductase